MQIKIFSVPVSGDERLEEELNHFLRANKVIDIRKELAMPGGGCCWTFCITYLQESRPTEAARQGSGAKVDYKEVLEPEAFERFANLRKVRKQIAESEAIPAFAVFTDAELAEMAKLQELTLAAMQGIAGIGKKKLEKYGNAFVASQKGGENETDGPSDGADSGA